MKKIIAGIILASVGYIYAATDMNEFATTAHNSYVVITSSVAVDMSSGTAVGGMLGYNICNEDSSAVIRCGYYVNVSTTAPGEAGFSVSKDAYGWPIRAKTCEYRAVVYGRKIYCKAEGTGTINAVREVFGR